MSKDNKEKLLDTVFEQFDEKIIGKAYILAKKENNREFMIKAVADYFRNRGKSPVNDFCAETENK